MSTKVLEVIGFILIIIMSLAFVGAFRPTIDPGLSTLFWICAAGILMIIIYKKKWHSKNVSNV